MLIGENSPLRRVPIGINAELHAFCDGVRFSAQMADLAYGELVACLLPLSQTNNEQGREFAVKPFLNAWSIIDSAYRLYRLVKNFPNLQKKNQAPQYRDFERKITAVERLRNAVQHMHSDIYESATAGRHVWGVLTWVKPTVAGGFTCLLVSGAVLPGGEYTPINPAGKVLRLPLDHVTLTVDKVDVNLTEIMDSMAKLVISLEEGLEKAFENLPNRTMSDMLIALAFQSGPSSPTPPDKQHSTEG